MKIICAGLSKTGTKSIAKALRILGYTVYDLDEHWLYHVDEWNQALGTNVMPDFKRMYEGVDAVTDSPPCFYFDELLQVFPDAKVILSMRESEDHWLKSFLKTCDIWQSEATSPRIIAGFIFTPTGRKWAKLLQKSGEVTLKNLSGNDLVKVYVEHNAKVKARVQEDQLLVYQVKEGWEPLCDFLGHEVPAMAFPRENCGSKLISGMVKNSSIASKMFRELNLMLVFLVVVVAFAVYLFYF